MCLPDHIRQIVCPALGDPNDPDGYKRAFLLARHELPPLIPSSASIITFDGVDGIGKSPLAREVASELDAKAIDLDDFLKKHQGRFVDAINTEKLANAISAGVHAKGRVVISGCLMGSVLRRLSLSSDFRIYLAKTSGLFSNPDAGDQFDEHELLCGDESADELTTREDSDAKRFGGRLAGLRRELIHYHRSDKPHLNADLIIRMQRLS